MKLFFDIETLSDIDLLEEGLKKYATSKTTRAFIIAYAVDDQPVEVATEIEEFDRFFTLSQEANEIWAFNTQFDYTVLHERYGFDPAITQLRDAHALASCNGYVGSLEIVAKALGLDLEKDEVGSKLMKRISKEKSLRVTPEEMMALKKYAGTDVEVLRAIVKRLGAMPIQEQKIWEMNFRINARGIPLHTKFIDCALDIIHTEKQETLAKFVEATNGQVGTPQSYAAFKKWLAARGVTVKSVDKQSVEDLLDSETITDEKVIEALKLKRNYGLTSLSKYETAKKQAVDNRIYHCFQYHAASQTGRFSGRGLQPHNLKRNQTVGQAEIAVIVDVVLNSANPGSVLKLLGYEPLTLLSTVIRTMIHSDKGISTCDFSAIESRLLAFMAGETWKLDAYARGDDIYVLTYARAFNIEPSKVTKTQRTYGKIMELAFGYGGWTGALHGMAKNYGVKFTEEEAVRLATAWRESNQASVKWLKMLELAAIEVIKNKKPIRLKHDVIFAMDNRDLLITLPSGRVMRYPSVLLSRVIDKFGRDKTAITFKTITNKVSIRSELYSGVFGNNIIQGIARDLLCDALLECERQDIEIVGHIHDEIVSGYEIHKVVSQIMETPVSWLNGFIPKVSGEHLRYFV